MPPTDPRPGLIDGRSEFTSAVRDCLRRAARHRAREICLVDADFQGWPLDDPDVLAALDAWVRLPKRRMLIVAGRFDAVPRAFPRFARWRVTWAHALECRATDVETSQIPTLLLAEAASLHLADRERWRGHLLADDREVADWREVVDVLVQRSEPDFGASTLGL